MQQNPNATFYLRSYSGSFRQRSPQAAGGAEERRRNSYIGGNGSAQVELESFNGACGDADRAGALGRTRPRALAARSRYARQVHYIGTAGWTIPARHRALGRRGTHLTLRARVPRGGVNSPSTGPMPNRRIAVAESTPPGFLSRSSFLSRSRTILNCGVRARRSRRFSPRRPTRRPRGPLLVQLRRHCVRRRGAGASSSSCASATLPGVCEPRHATWFTPQAAALLTRFEVGRVAADPACAPGAVSRAWPGIVYYRLHGSPRTYWSRYTRGSSTPRPRAPRWGLVHFDNPPRGRARHALELQAMLLESSSRARTQLDRAPAF